MSNAFGARMRCSQHLYGIRSRTCLGSRNVVGAVNYEAVASNNMAISSVAEAHLVVFKKGRFPARIMDCMALPSARLIYKLPVVERLPVGLCRCEMAARLVTGDGTHACSR